MSTPAVSAVIRKQKAKHIPLLANGGFIMSASHNPGGPEYDWGIKFNYSSGQPAPETITDKIYGNTLSHQPPRRKRREMGGGWGSLVWDCGKDKEEGFEKIQNLSIGNFGSSGGFFKSEGNEFGEFKMQLEISEIKMVDIPDIDLSCLGVTTYGNFSVEVVDPVSDYLELLENVFDFQLIKGLLSRSDFRFTFDAMHAVTGAYAKPIFVDKLGASPDSISNGVPLEDFGHGHPDPNLTYAKDLVNIMYGVNGPDFGAASDGDGDRNMILGRSFFVTPSDSVAIIAANAQQAIPYFQSGPKGLARSMPTSGALDRVAEKLTLPFFEVPTGWKFFGNLMDAGKLSICGEEVFGTGSDHIREKDGICIAGPDHDLVSKVVMNILRDLVSKSKAGEKYGNYALQFADDFSYTDPVDGSVASKQGVRFVFTDGSRIIYRLSGTGSAGATVRIYIEQFEPDVSKHEMDAQAALKPLIDLALSLSKLKDFTGREKLQ
ncbi:Phosphoglucomutase, chloroplastic [Vitis vinifera]|uniref:phosphoglucomutase (alpha-D-glucose-1,6-bisphosphate-dependent) n=1 Tax=Vitis vinifera TaxID=29760 RepID=A0A438EEJ3_VITVI|nr:Phosphoglucomutase, chloroplastic [Vitis vinifera]